MKRLSLHYILLSVLLLSCASTNQIGRDFNHHSISSLALGTTTPQQAIALLGKPNTTQSISNNDGEFDVFNFSNANVEIWLGTIQDARSLELVFYQPPDAPKKVLDSYFFFSSYQPDQHDTLITDIDEIKKGLTTQNAVLSLLGEPNGKSLNHVKGSRASADDLIVDEYWTYISWAKEDKQPVQMLVQLGFDTLGIVRAITKSKKTAPL
ncbi:MAG: hypothetical protein AAGA18_14220 [Verrucomicrobiota bacterium]